MATLGIPISRGNNENMAIMPGLECLLACPGLFYMALIFPRTVKAVMTTENTFDTVRLAHTSSTVAM